MKHRKPPNLRIGAETITVKLLPDSSEDQGQWCPTSRTISILGGLTKHQEALVLLHEALHAIADQYGLRLSEKSVRTLEQALGGLFRDNPSTFKWLLQGPESAAR
jgi:hypothetical protein